MGAGYHARRRPASRRFRRPAEARNTIIAGNTANGAEDDCALGRLPFTDNNLSGDDSCGFTDSGSKQNTNPQLRALAQQRRADRHTQRSPSARPPLTTRGWQRLPRHRPARGRPAPARHLRHRRRGARAADRDHRRGQRPGINSAAILGRSVNPFIEAGTATFEFGTTTAYGRSVPSGGAGAALRQAQATAGVAASASEAESAGLTGLAANTLYHYRLVVQNARRHRPRRRRHLHHPAGAASRRPTVAAAGVPGGCVRRAFNLRVRVRVSSGTRLKAVRVTLDGRRSSARPSAASRSA